MLGDAAADRSRFSPQRTMETMSAPATRADWAAPQREIASEGISPLGSDPIRRRAFAAAKRHSRLVRFMRVATPTAGLLAVAAMIAIALFDPFRREIGGLTVGEFSVDGSKIVMSHPHLTGTRKDGHGYVVNAAKAIQDVAHPAAVELREIDGDVTMGDNSRMRINAAFGLYDNVRQFLKLSQNVHLRSPSYDVTLDTADIDFKTGIYRSDQPVTVATNSGATIHSDSAEARDNGAEMTFIGHVRSTFAGEAGAASAPGDLKGTAP
jgi:lipopolysaccharide export system protein LptC